MPGPSQFDDAADGQDQAEALDETVLDDREQVGEMRTFEELPDLLDVTSEPEDDDEPLVADNDDEPGPDDVEGPFRVLAGAGDTGPGKGLDEDLEDGLPGSDRGEVTRRED